MTTIDLSEPDPPRRGAWLAVLWTVLALVYAGILRIQVNVPWSGALVSAFTYFYSLGVLTIPLTKMSRWLLKRPRAFAQHLAAHSAAAVVGISVWQGAQVVLHRVTVGPDFWALVYAHSWLFQLLTAAVIYAATIATIVAVLALERDRSRVRREHQLEVAARDAQLAALKAQFQPHFVLNSLNSLLALIDRDPALARTMVVRLSDLMKAVFERDSDRLVPLERELDLVRAYLDIERIRLGSRLSVAFKVDDNARAVLVPPFLLQPVVENAVKHGVAPFARPGFVEVSASIAAGRLRVEVRDSGTSGAATAGVSGPGRGLQITRGHLTGAFGDAYDLTIHPGPGGTAVAIEVPLDSPRVA